MTLLAAPCRVSQKAATGDIAGLFARWNDHGNQPAREELVLVAMVGMLNAIDLRGPDDPRRTAPPFP
jgi:hypothetical protein